jgi:uncharacterized protein YceH (UPF0502 family)
MDLSDSEIRVLGCLLEKQRTTPDHYPLSLNSLRLACNQATNREPVVDYEDAQIRDAVHRLERRGYARLAGASRAAKYRHLLAEALPMSSGEQAIMCVLMLRGAQTPGELKQRGERMYAFEALDEVHVTLSVLIERGLVARLDRRPGQKEERYKQLLGEDAEADMGSLAQATARPPQHIIHSSQGASLDSGLAERVARLEREVAELRAALAELGGEASAPKASTVEHDEAAVPSETGSQEPHGLPREWSEQIPQPFS